MKKFCRHSTQLIFYEIIDFRFRAHISPHKTQRHVPTPIIITVIFFNNSTLNHAKNFSLISLKKVQVYVQQLEFVVRVKILWKTFSYTFSLSFSFLLFSSFFRTQLDKLQTTFTHKAHSALFFVEVSLHRIRLDRFYFIHIPFFPR